METECRTLLAAQDAREQNAGAVYGKQRTNRIELGRKYFEHNECKRELSNCGPDVCSLKRSLCCADLDQLGAG
jgi:hypothetical protein